MKITGGEKLESVHAIVAQTRGSRETALVAWLADGMANKGYRIVLCGSKEGGTNDRRNDLSSSPLVMI